MVVWMLAGVYLVLLCVCAIAVRPYDTYASPVVVTGFAGIFYLVGIPLEIEVSGVRYLRLDRNIFISSDIGRETVLLAITAFVSWFAGYWLVMDRRRRVQSLPPLRSGDAAIAVKALVVIVVGAVLALVSVYPSQLIAAHDYASQYGQRYALPGYSVLTAFAGVGVGMLAFILGWRSRRGWVPALVLVACLVGWGIYSNGKDPILVAGLALSGIYVRRWDRFQRAAGFAVTVAVSLVAAALGTLLFSLLRGGSTDVSGALHRTGLLVGIEPAGPFYSVVAQLSGESTAAGAYSTGQSVILGLVSWIPRAFWPDRPDDLGAAFAKTHIDNWSPGRGYGYSPLAEGLLNGNLLGVVLLFALIGAIVGLARNHLLNPSASTERRIVGLAFYSVYLMEQNFILYRGPFSLLITNLIQGLGFYLVVRIAVGFLRYLDSGKRANSPAHSVRKSRDVKSR